MATDRTILDFMDRVLPAQFQGDTWAAWRIVLQALFGLPLSDDELATFQALTGRATAPTEPSSELWAVVGRRGGKSAVAALVSTYLATCRTYPLAAGERGVLPIIAADRRQARVVAGYVKGLLHSTPILEALIERELRDSVELSTGVTIEIHTASYRTIRGYTVVAAVCDEIAFWPVDESAAEPDRAILDALRPAMATIPDALLLCLSTPYARRGELHRAVDTHYGEDGDVLVIRADTATMNPAVRQAVIDRAYTRDPVAAASEYGKDGEIAFRADVSALLTEAAIAAVVPEGIRELPPDPRRRASAHFDAATGSGADSAALGIAFEGGELALVRRWQPPFNPGAVVREAAGLAAAYGVRWVGIDRYAPGLVAELFREHGTSCQIADHDTSAGFVELLALVNSKRLTLLDEPVLLAEVRRLERKTGSGGRDIVGHPPGGHDDVAAAATGALLQAAGARTAGAKPVKHGGTWGRRSTGLRTIPTHGAAVVWPRLPESCRHRGMENAALIYACCREAVRILGGVGGHLWVHKGIDTSALWVGENEFRIPVVVGHVLAKLRSEGASEERLAEVEDGTAEDLKQLYTDTWAWVEQYLDADPALWEMWARACLPESYKRAGKHIAHVS